jgi:predicted choloylglycine hydrolase
MKRNSEFYIMLFPLLILFIISCQQIDNNAPNLSQYSSAQLDSLTLYSLKKINSYPFYTMTYYSDYGFDDYLKGKKDYPVTWANTDISQFYWRCSCFASMGRDGDKLYGRNFDYFNTVPLLLYTNPQNGHASMSMVDIQFLGYDQLNHLPDSIDSRKALLNAPWLPVDGINEKGVTAGLLAVEEEEPPFYQKKVTINELALIRLVLDYADNTEHAISLIQNYNVNTASTDDESEHFLIADPTGNSVIIEFLDKKMIVIKNEKPWQVATNFNLHRYQKDSIKCERYKFAYQRLNEKAGNLTTCEAMKLLEDIAQSRSTKWSCIYNMSNCMLHVAVRTKYNNVYKISLKKFNDIITVNFKK